MVTEKTLAIARALEEFGRHKICLVEKLLGNVLTIKDRDQLYGAAIRDQFDLVFSSCPEVKALELYIALQIEEMQSTENTYFAGQKLGRQPNQEEVKAHYLASGRPSEFSQLFCAMLARQ